MGKNRRQFSKEFKVEAVRLIIEEGRRISELARELGIAESLLGRWKKKYEEGKIDPFPGKGRLSPEDAELNAKGHVCGRHRVARLMRQHGIVSKHKRKFRVTTNSVHSYPIAENLLQRRFDVSGAGQCWVSDITYIPTREGWLYLAATLDLFHRKVIGWAMGRWITRQLAMNALNMAIKNESPLG